MTSAQMKSVIVREPHNCATEYRSRLPNLKRRLVLRIRWDPRLQSRESSNYRSRLAGIQDESAPTCRAVRPATRNFIPNRFCYLEA